MKRVSLLVLLAMITVSVLSTPASAQLNYALGKSYTVDPLLTPSSVWWLGEDPPYTKWTDGSSNFVWGDMTGWQGPDYVSSATIVLDLGETKTDIGKVQVDQMVSHVSTVYECNQIKCYGSENGVDFTFWGDLDAPGMGGDEIILVWSWEPTEAKTARYVKYELYWPSENQGSHKLLSEIYVFKYQAPASSVSLPWYNME
ncbi:hypothetical protein J7M23_08765 [Candidatus Sumerlaeota bacterium]|nr:hypothetical protein [Candidatus Sumerlaeota bacterium]